MTKNELIIDGKRVNENTLVTAYRFYQKYWLKGGEYRCPLCDCDLEENGLFCCEECGELKELSEKCTEHADGKICQDCCEECGQERAYWNSVNARIDEMRGH